MKIFKTLPKTFLTKDYFKTNSALLWNGDILNLLDKLSHESLIDLVITSPPYNIGKEYEESSTIEEYFINQHNIISKLDSLMSPNGSICWQVGNHVDKEGIYPLDFGFDKIFRELGYVLKNRIIWKFGHGFHAKKRFSGRYEVILWYVKSQQYTFNLDPVRVPSKYPAKTYYKGPKKGQISSNPLGKNPEDVWNQFDVPEDGHDDFWDIPNVKGGHVEKTNHPCQFPIGLAERLILSLSNENDLVLDPFMGAGSSGIAAIKNHRKFIGADLDASYCSIAKERFSAIKNGTLKYRPYQKPVFDHKLSPLSTLTKNK